MVPKTYPGPQKGPQKRPFFDYLTTSFEACDFMRDVDVTLLNKGFWGVYL